MCVKMGERRSIANLVSLICNPSASRRLLLLRFIYLFIYSKHPKGQERALYKGGSQLDNLYNIRDKTRLTIHIKNKYEKEKKTPRTHVHTQKEDIDILIHWCFLTLRAHVHTQ